MGIEYKLNDIEEQIINLIHAEIESMKKIAKHIERTGGWNPLCHGDTTDAYSGVEVGIGNDSKNRAITDKNFHIEISKNGTLIVHDKNNQYTIIDDTKKREEAIRAIYDAIPAKYWNIAPFKNAITVLTFYKAKIQSDNSLNDAKKTPITKDIDDLEAALKADCENNPQLLDSYKGYIKGMIAVGAVVALAVNIPKVATFMSAVVNVFAEGMKGYGIGFGGNPTLNTANLMVSTVVAGTAVGAVVGYSRQKPLSANDIHGKSLDAAMVASRPNL